ncbi:unnamed protein product, partial [Polarella glacialis]
FDAPSAAMLLDSPLLPESSDALRSLLFPLADRFVQALAETSLDFWRTGQYQQLVRDFGVENFGVVGGRRIYAGLGIAVPDMDFLRRAKAQIPRIGRMMAESFSSDGADFVRQRVLTYAEFEFTAPEFRVPLYGTGIYENGKSYSSHWLTPVQPPFCPFADRGTCSEFRMLAGFCNAIARADPRGAADAEARARITGQVCALVSGPCCVSCVGAFTQFLKLFPQVTVQVCAGKLPLLMMLQRGVVSAIIMVLPNTQDAAIEQVYLKSSEAGAQSIRLMRVPVKEGEMTKTIYQHIMEQQYEKAVRILNNELQTFPDSRCALSLLGFCYYHMQDFHNSASTYGQLVQSCPEVDEYKVYHVQSLMKAGLYEEASQACTTVENPDFTERVMLLQAAISYEQDEVQLARSILDQCSPDAEEKQVFEGALLWKEKRHVEAMKQFSDAMTTTGYQPDLAYNVALCYYSTKQYGPALKHIAEIIERGVRDHPELSVGALSEGAGGLQARSVGNTGVLKETALVEAFNLK